MIPTNQLIAILRKDAQGSDGEVKFRILDACDRLERKTRDCELLRQKVEKLLPKKPMTNADRIRAMSDEELADFLYEGADDRYCKNYPKCGELLCTEDGIPEGECKRCLMSWLQQPAEATK